ncbi:hypothetical protein AB1Y20_021936 [Prymnesium parvum]|uniref:Uncharacterized protein n=1 Tax=Prymnesium parvum TaxID=97485 RepID=A0AB34JFG8_PRYPA
MAAVLTATADLWRRRMLLRPTLRSAHPGLSLTPSICTRAFIHCYAWLLTQVRAALERHELAPLAADGETSAKAIDTIRPAEHKMAAPPLPSSFTMKRAARCSMWATRTPP